MIRKLCLLLLACNGTTLRAGDDLAAQFQHPPPQAKTHVWWHWMNGNISKAGITADLEAMARVGVGGAQIFNAECGIPAGPVKFMTPAWHAMIAHAAREADRLGLELGVHNCAGWTSSGGPWVTPELAMQDVVSSEVRVQGPAHFAETLPKPATRIAYYRDIAVLAFPTPLDGPLMAERKPKVTASVANFDGEKLMDRDGGSVATLPLPKPGAPQFVQFEFAEPFPAQALLVTIPGGVDYTADYGLCEAQALLQASSDGQKFRTIRPLVLERKMFGPMPVGFTFVPVCERFYRVVFTRVGERSPRLALAELELLARPRMENLEAKANYTVGVGLKPEKQPVPAAHFLPRTGVVDLTKQLAPDGRLIWDVPAGQWTILRLGHTPTGKGNHPPAEGGYGLECDKLSKAALDAHWAGMMQSVLADVGPLAGKSFKNAIIDSYEVGGQNWTPRMREEFQRRRGYDPLPYLPVFSGRVVESSEITERFLFDLRRTISDLFAENYYGRFQELCHARGLQALVEPYSGPYDSQQVGAAADLPMGEFWMQRAPNPSVKLASSIAHVNGQRVIGAESFTADPATEFWDKDLFAYKALGDLVYCAGINKFVLHRFTHQPWPDRVPGMTMGQWGSHFDRTSTWWEQSRAWFSYCARCQALLQAGRFCADVAYYAGEATPSEMPVREKLQPSLPSGYDFDQLGSDVLLKARVENGRLVLPSGMTYRVLVLPPKGQYTPRVLRKLKGLAEAGATLVGPKPTQSPSLENFPACDDEVRQLATALWGACDGKTSTENKCGAGKIIWGQPLSDVFAALRVEPDFACAPTNNPKVAYIHRTTGDAELYFVSNQKPVAQELQCVFRISGKQPELWHPDTGQMELAAVFREEAGRTIVPLRLDPAGSVFVVFRKAVGKSVHFTTTDFSPLISGPDSFPAITISRDSKGKLVPAIWKSGAFTFHTASGQVQTLQVCTVPQPRELDGAWELSFPPNWGAPEQITLPKLASWTTHENPGVKYFSGTACYKKTFELPPEWLAAGLPMMLDLGAVKNLAEVSLNGHDLGILWKPPFRVDISGAACAGENRLEIKVTNLWCNRLIGDEQLPDDIEWARGGFWAHAGPEAWPTWLLQGQPRPSGRKTFTTWHYFNKSSPLLESGLLGPVTVRAAQMAEISIGKSERGKQMKKHMLVASVMCAAALVARGADEWPAYTVDWRAGVESPADVSFLLSAPAGKDGFIKVKDGHFVKPDGSRLRIWGINATGAAGLPATNNAPVIAAALARRGINCIRFHFLDSAWALTDAKGDNTRSLNPEALDRLDRFVFELKQRGIYADLNLNVYRSYKPGDGVRESEWLGIGKGATYFDERLLELQREYARNLLTHVNRYTGHAYREEPAVAVIEFVNENSLVEAWLANRLVGNQTNKPNDTWHDIPPSYAADLTKKFNAWLPKHVPTAKIAAWRDASGSVPRLNKQQALKADADRFDAEAGFLMKIERDFFRNMAKFLREDLGVKNLLVGDSDHNHGMSGYPHVAALAQLDAVDGHIYWQHPHYLTDPRSKRRAGFSIPNTPMVDDPPHSSVVQLSRTAVAGKPYTISEANHPFPAEYACEGVPVLAAYAALQDWDGIFWYSLAHQDVTTMEKNALAHFDFAKDAVKLNQIAAGALMFLRGDVHVAKQTLARSYSHEQVLASLRMTNWKEQPYFTPGFPLTLPLIHSVRVSSFDGPPTGAFAAVPTNNITSDTSEIVWRASGKGTGLVVVDTPRSQALIGFLATQSGATKNLRAEMRTPFTAITLGALDAKPIVTASRLLVTVGSRMMNSGMTWNEKKTSLENWGNAPARLEPLAGKVILQGLENASAVTAQPLDGDGAPLGAPIQLTRTADSWTLDLGQPATAWYVLTVQRSR